MIWGLGHGAEQYRKALRTLGMREDDPARLVAAVQAFKAALVGYTRIWPLQRAMTQENIAIAELALA